MLLNQKSHTDYLLVSLVVGRHNAYSYFRFWPFKAQALSYLASIMKQIYTLHKHEVFCVSGILLRLNILGLHE